MNCPLCSAAAVAPLPVAGQVRRYHACADCRLVFVDPRDHLSPEQEFARYRLHRNSPENAGYVAFLRQVLAPALPLIPRGAAVLDYGCGPAPVLAQLLAAAGCAADSYDPCFTAPPAGREQEVPAGSGMTGSRPPGMKYAAVFATEVIEHFRRPGAEFAQMLARLAPGGLLCLMTELYRDDTNFARWPYTSDPTHVAFYHEMTLARLAANHRLTPVFTDHARVVLLRLVCPTL